MTACDVSAPECVTADEMMLRKFYGAILLYFIIYIL